MRLKQQGKKIYDNSNGKQQKQTQFTCKISVCTADEPIRRGVYTHTLSSLPRNSFFIVLVTHKQLHTASNTHGFFAVLYAQTLKLNSINKKETQFQNTAARCYTQKQQPYDLSQCGDLSVDLHRLSIARFLTQFLILNYIFRKQPKQPRKHSHLAYSLIIHRR